MKKAGKKETKGSLGRVASVLKGTALAFVVTCVVFVVYALLLTYTDISEQYISLVAIISAAVSCALGGFVSAKEMETRGIVWGVLTGILYAVILFIINRLAGAEQTGLMPKITMLVCTMASGGIGGILGINK